jgi:hypothetical protein
MAESTLLHPQDTPPITTKGHGTEALGPSDSSDTGSDVRGGPGLDHEVGIGPRRGDTSDPDSDRGATTAGPDIGDADLDSDTDRQGTGERRTVGRDATEPTDQTLRTADDGRPIDAADIGEEGDLGDDSK